MTDKNIALKPGTVALLKKRARGCFMCKHIVSALDEDATLRDWPVQAESECVIFPVESQEAHIRLELQR